MCLKASMFLSSWLQTGHEYPFSIQMSHIKEPLGPTSIKGDAATPSDKEMELLIDQLQSDNQCQFILKPSRVAVGHSFVGKGVLHVLYLRRKSQEGVCYHN